MGRASSVSSNRERAERDLSLCRISAARTGDRFEHSTFSAIQRIFYSFRVPDHDQNAFFTRRSVGDKKAIARAVVAICENPKAFEGFDYSDLADYGTALDNIKKDGFLARLPTQNLYDELIRHVARPKDIEIILNWNILRDRSEDNEEKTEAGNEKTGSLVLYNRLGGLNRGIATGFIRLLLLGEIPSAEAIKRFIPPQTKDFSGDTIEIENGLTGLGDKLKGIDLPLSRLTGKRVNWPADAPIQTVDDLAEIVSAFTTNLEEAPEDRFTEQFKDWLASRQGVSAAETANKAISAKDYELVPQDVAVLRLLLAMGPETGYIYLSPEDITPVLARSSAFSNIAYENIKYYLGSTLIEAPNRYAQAISHRERDLAALTKNPKAPGYLMDQLFRKLRSTRVTATHTLEGISPETLKSILNRKLRFEDLKMRILGNEA